MHKVRVPRVFQDGARPLDVAQAAILLGWTKDAVRAASERGELEHGRDHLNAYRVPCSAVVATAARYARVDLPDLIRTIALARARRKSGHAGTS